MFTIAVIMNLIAALLAVLVLKPMRAAHFGPAIEAISAGSVNTRWK